jgi:hypothetical protein
MQGLKDLAASHVQPVDKTEREKAPVARRKRPPLSSSRKSLLKAYEASYALIPDYVCCAACSIPSHKDSMERHHPAGRRKDAFCFTFMLHTSCHQRVHADPAWAASVGLLWPGRNSKVLSMADAVKLVQTCPCPPNYSLRIFSQAKE